MSTKVDEIETEILKHKIFIKNQRSNINELLRIPTIKYEQTQPPPKLFNHKIIKKRPNFIFISSTTRKKDMKSESLKDSVDSRRIDHELVREQESKKSPKTSIAVQCLQSSDQEQPVSAVLNDSDRGNVLTVPRDQTSDSQQRDSSNEIIMTGEAIKSPANSPKLEYIIRDDLETRLADWIKREVLLKVMENGNSSESNSSVLSESSKLESEDHPMEQNYNEGKSMEELKNEEAKDISQDKEKEEPKIIYSHEIEDIESVHDSHNSENYYQDSKQGASQTSISKYHLSDERITFYDEISAIEQPFIPEPTFELSKCIETIPEIPKEVAEGYKILLTESETHSFSVPSNSNTQEMQEIDIAGSKMYSEKEIQADTDLKQQGVQVSEWSESGEKKIETVNEFKEESVQVSEWSESGEKKIETDKEFKQQSVQVSEWSESSISDPKSNHETCRPDLSPEEPNDLEELSELDMQIQLNESMSEFEPWSSRIVGPVLPIKDSENKMTMTDNKESKKDVLIQHEQASQYDPDSEMILEVSSIIEKADSSLKHHHKETSSRQTPEKKNNSSENATKSLSLTMTTMSLSEGEIIGPLLSEGEVLFKRQLPPEELDTDLSTSTGWAATSSLRNQDSSAGEIQDTSDDFSSKIN